MGHLEVFSLKHAFESFFLNFMNLSLAMSESSSIIFLGFFTWVAIIWRSTSSHLYWRSTPTHTISAAFLIFVKSSLASRLSSTIQMYLRASCTLCINCLTIWWSMSGSATAMLVIVTTGRAQQFGGSSESSEGTRCKT